MTAIGFVVWHIKQHVILAVEKDLSPDMVICVHQKPEGYLKGALNFTRVRCDFGQGGNNPKKGRHAVSADSIETRQSSQELNVLGPNSDFLFGFPQGPSARLSRRFLLFPRERQFAPDGTAWFLAAESE